MADLSGHKAAQAADANALAANANKVGRRALSSSTLLIAQHVLDQAMRDSGKPPLNETAADMLAVRSDPKLRQALEEDLELSRDAVLDLVLQAMEDGLDTEMTWQASQFKGMTWTMTTSDTVTLNGYPIQGHMPYELVAYMHSQLGYEVAGLISAPLDGSTSAGSLSAQLEALLTKFGERVGGAVSEAYFAGVQLGVRTTAEAIANAR